MKSGLVAVVGRPNAGKSTLVNVLVGEKVSIVSSRPQTTRGLVRGVVTHAGPDREPDWQMILIDTPGLHKPSTELGRRLNQAARASLSECDAALFVIDVTKVIGAGDQHIASLLAEAGVVTIVTLAKLDLAGPELVAPQLSRAAAWGFTSYVPVSSVTGAGIDALIEETVSLLPEGPLYFPSEARSDQPEQVLLAEIVRERFLDRLSDELPHSLAVRVTEWEERQDGLLWVAADLVVERPSQKGIIIGKGGGLIKLAGTEARLDLEKLFGRRIHLDLHVRVEPDWQTRPQLLDRLGF